MNDEINNIEKERENWRKKARDIAENIVSKRAVEIDNTGEFPWDIANTFSENGLLSLLIPKEYGGMDADITSFCFVVEEIARYCASSSLLVIVQAVGTLPVVFGGNEGLKNFCLSKLAKEKALISFCLTEPDYGSDAASIRTKAEYKGDHYLVNGRKCFITNGGVSDFYSVFATTNPEKRIEGIIGFVIEKGTPGLIIGKEENKMGFRGSNTTEVILDNVKVPINHRLGEEGTGWWLMMRTLNRSRPAIGAQAVGVAQGALDYLIKFSKEKGWFEKGDEETFIKFKLAEMAIEIEASRALVYKAASIMDEKVKGTPVQIFSSMSKYFASDVAMRITTDAVQLLEWQGITKRHPLERMMRDAKLIQIFEGTNQIQRMVVAHTLLKTKD
jgi:alkylation response protein AidB-like acyl-CoA dehydrogenase